MNKVILLGRVGGDPEVRELKETKVCKFSLATSETYKKNDEKVTETTWHNLVFWGKQCDTLKTWVRKGDHLLIEGKIQTREYTDKEGTKHWANEIVCDRFELIGSKKDDKPQANDKWQGKKEVKSMSNVDELPQHVRDAENMPDNEIPF